MDGDLHLLTIVGIAGDTHEYGLEQPARPTVYVNFLQRPRSTFSIVMHSDMDIAQLTSAAREMVHEEAPDAAPRFRTFQQIYANSLGSRRFNLTLVGVFALTALLLAVGGVYGVVAFNVAQRTQEIGVRMAVGARNADVLGLILRQGRTTTLITVSFGVTDALTDHQEDQDVSLAGVPVLVVDDNATNPRILIDTLRKWGMQPEAAAGAHEAIDLLKSAQERGQPFSMILTDVHMPQTDGFTLVEQVKKQSDFSTPTIMMLTSGGQLGDGARCRALGVSAYLTKPVRTAELNAAVTLLVAERSAGHSHRDTKTLVTQHSLREGRPGISGPLCILLAEDNLVNQHLALRILQKQGHHVIVADNGRKAVDALEGHQVDIVLMDIQMPEMDGFEATALIRQQEKATGKHVPMMTTSGASS